MGHRHGYVPRPSEDGDAAFQPMGMDDAPPAAPLASLARTLQIPRTSYFLMLVLAVSIVTALLLKLRPTEVKSETVKCLVTVGGVPRIGGGYGDYIKIHHRGELVAKILGCEVLPLYVDSSHHYLTSDVFSTGAITAVLDSTKTCYAGDLIDMNILEANNDNCDIPLSGYYKKVPEDCTSITYHPRILTPPWTAWKLPCVADRLRDRMTTLPSSIENCAAGYVALHFRWGDLANHPQDPRSATISELERAIEAAQSVQTFPPECVIVFAEGYLEPKIANLNVPHTVNTDNNIFQVMGNFAGSAVLFGTQSGMMTALALAFQGHTLITVSNLGALYQGIVRKGTRVIQISGDFDRNWSNDDDAA